MQLELLAAFGLSVFTWLTAVGFFVAASTERKPEIPRRRWEGAFNVLLFGDRLTVNGRWYRALGVLSLLLFLLSCFVGWLLLSLGRS